MRYLKIAVAFIFLMAATIPAHAAINEWKNEAGQLTGISSSYTVSIDHVDWTVTLRKDTGAYSPKLVLSSLTYDPWVIKSYKLSFNENDTSGTIPRKNCFNIEGERFGVIPTFSWRTVGLLSHMNSLSIHYNLYDSKRETYSVFVELPEDIVREWREVTSHK